MNNLRKRILLEAIEHYGIGHQLVKVIEELSELIQALAKNDDDHVAEELADVRIMLDQLELILDNHDRVQEWEYEKLMRLDARVHAADTVRGDTMLERRRNVHG